MADTKYHYLILDRYGDTVFRDGDMVTDFKRFRRDINPVAYVIVEDGKLILRGFGEDREVKSIHEACDIANPILFEMKHEYLKELHKALSPRGRIAPLDQIYYDEILEEVQDHLDHMEDLKRWWKGEPDPIEDEWYSERAAGNGVDHA